ncbi:MAG: NAD(+) synthase [Planctomycetia bacterium]|nr:NAD(+) synthase [Planctomycetia bacterium]
MQLIRVGGIALNQTPLDWNGNRDRIIAAIDTAKQRGLSVVCLPELCLSGYGCEDAFQSPGMQRMALQVLAEIVSYSAGLIVAIGLPIQFESSVYDAVALLVDGRIVGLVPKQHLAGEGIHYEPRWFRPWPKGKRSYLALEGRSVPIGDVRFDCGGVRIGFEICEDAWVAQRPGASLAARGVDLILNPSASHFAFGKDDIRQRFVLEGSRAFGVGYIYSNLLGNEAGRAIYDGGVLIAAAGKLVASGRRFVFGDYVCSDAILDLDTIRLGQSRLAIQRLEIIDAGECVTVPFAWPTLTPQPEITGPTGRDAWEQGSSIKEEEFTRAVALGLFDYLRKSHSHGFVVSASGGADSSAVACLIAIALRLAAREMPVVDVAKRLGLSPAIAGRADGSVQKAVAIEHLTRAVLTCVYQSTVNSGAVTRASARHVAEAIGATFYEFDVDSIFRRYEEIVSAALGRPLSWEQDDVALQNIQARVRAPGAWMLANISNALLVSTSNRSEAAVGYATMDGDTSGGIAPIAGIDKAYLRLWLKWLEKIGPESLGPLPVLAAVNVQDPTAELRPPTKSQTDEADLMPYDVLDAVERSAIRDKQTPLEAWQRLTIDFPHHPPRQLAIWTDRFFMLWSRNQWKRERYAPSFHLDDENLDPKTWCRFPILSGGFARERAALRLAAGIDRS